MTQHNNKTITRRRCLEIIAAGAAAALELKSAPLALARNQHMQKLNWQGVLLGADASITVYTSEVPKAKKALDHMLKEVRRLEGYFSLFLKDSLINQLNREGRLMLPPKDMQELITYSLAIAEKSKGRFDPTIQPLFNIYKSLSAQKVTGNWLERKDVIAAKSLIDWQRIHVSSKEIKFARKGMAITLNGIAQGYITDRAVHILKEAGFKSSLVNFGEYRAIGEKTEQESWTIKLGQGENAPVWKVRDKAVAASAYNGMILNHLTGLHHLLDPLSGTNQPDWREVYVLAPNATDADAASTALFASPPSEIDVILEQLAVERVFMTTRDGNIIHRDLTHRT